MFFIVPSPTKRAEGSGRNVALSAIPPESSNTKRKRTLVEPDGINTYYPRRTPKACDRCRVKKAKCTGGLMCARCKQDNVVCVTTRESKKSSLALNPAYVHLVESQRDRLVHALSEVLEGEDTVKSAKLKQALADMGIPTANALRVSLESSSACEEESSLETEARSDTWENVFNDLDDEQIQAVNSFCVVAPLLQDGTATPTDADARLQSSSMPQFFNFSLPGDSRSLGFNDIYNWNHNITGMNQHLELHRDQETFDHTDMESIDAPVNTHLMNLKGKAFSTI